MTTQGSPRLKILQHLRAKDGQHVKMADLARDTGLAEDIVTNFCTNLEGAGFIVGFRSSAAPLSFAITDSGKIHAKFLESQR